MRLLPRAARRPSSRPLGALALAVVTVVTATGGTAPSSDRHGGPGGRDGHPRGCAAGAALLFCEDFEDLPRGAGTSPNWGVDTRHGTLAVEVDRGRGGKHRHNRVLRLRTEGNGHAFVEVDDFDAPGNGFFGRMRVRVDAFPTVPDWAHFTLVEAVGRGDGSVVRPIGGQYVPTVGGGVPLWGVGSDGGPTGDWTDWRESAPAEAGRWTCLEWELDASDNRVSVRIDGEPKPDLTVTTTRHGGNPVDFVLPDVDTVRIGRQLYQGDPTPDSYDLLLDDLALSTERVGCDR
ncbi:hypothetical protein F0L17_02045 [Streptomyces sp. TRM43335]|uniref:Uncharacterized protein n=1 Tax=Streptomyces taklimakanensis TaxID=2569853 RepID=A0A6G2B7P8_9ACTN|nr:hypothetical protein [Streptomyces taklimakanensis]MTE17932.1 hypothetical protein [Streptomyces taklimakanensis]